MAKQCLRDGCTYKVFGKGYCRNHQWMRSDYTKYEWKPKKTGQLELFHIIWNERDHVSFLTGKPLGGFDHWFFAHVLSKSQSKYPKFMLYKPNIILLSRHEHHLLDHGSIDQRKSYEKENNCSFDKIFKLKEELKNEYITKYGK